eukprot:gene31675-62225_t
MRETAAELRALRSQQPRLLELLSPQPAPPCGVTVRRRNAEAAARGRGAMGPCSRLVQWSIRDSDTPA